MVNVKDIRVERIDAASARAFVRRHHYSGKVANNSQLHFGAFYDGKLQGVMSFGPPMDKAKVLPLVEGTGWNEMVELNRMAFGPVLPRNSESRCIAIALRLLKKHCPQVKWVLSFADGTQCGDGAIYRATGFLLTSIKKNHQMIRMPDGFTVAQATLTRTGKNGGDAVKREMDARYGTKLFNSTASTVKDVIAKGGEWLPGFMLRYIYLLDKTARLTVPVLPYSRIDEMGAGMYKGQNVPVSERKPTPAPEAQTDERLHTMQEAGGSIPTPALLTPPT